MKIRFGVTVFLAFAIYHADAFAESVYPLPPNNRPLGMQQGNTGSCASEAQVSAMEYAFQARGYGVTLSTFNAHAFNWQSDTRAKSIYQDYSANDVALFNHFGRFVPNYMLPEDGRGYYMGIVDRLAISDFGAYDPGFPTAAATQQSDTGYVFFGNYSNTIGVDQLKSFVRQKLPVTLSIQGDITDQHNPTTGLIDHPYAYHPIVADNDRLAVKHAVALVGFDDDLVAAPGAAPGSFIVRNSWNENSEVYNQSSIDFNPSEMRDRDTFTRFRGKINSAKNEVGYFAIPYQYIRDLAGNGGGDAHVYGMRYDLFAQAFYSFENKYKIRMLPFYCNETGTTRFLRNAYPALLKDLNSKNADQKTNAIDHLMKMFSPGYMSRQGSIIKVAKVTVSTANNIDRERDFYNGNFKRYYCNNPLDDFGPQNDAMKRPDFEPAIDLLSSDSLGLSNWLYTFRMLYNYLGEKQ